MKAGLIAQKFAVKGRLVMVQNTGQGNINDTYLVIFRTAFSEERFILQTLNRRVFAHPEFVMQNMRTVTDYAHRRLDEESYMSDRIWQLPRVIPAKTGGDFVQDGDGEYWRAISLIASAHSYERVQSLEHAYEAGLVLSHFQRLVSDIPVASLKDTLPGYHQTPRYLEKMDRALQSAEGQERLNSSAEAQHCYLFIQQRREWCSVLEDACGRGELLLRPIHGDPKIANIMIDDFTGKGTAIIDLDTVKPGLIHYDIGDCLRSCCNCAGEDATDLNQVYFDTELLSVIVKGYMAYARKFLTPADHYYLYDCIRLLSFELGLRFFADFVAGNVYFKTLHEGQNLNRARVQFKLTESIESREVQIRKILDGYALKK